MAAVVVWAAVWGMGVDVDTLAARMDYQRYIYPQEKFHVMTDQAAYMGGDTIWLRGFVVDAASHQPVAVSRYLYVELCNPFHQVEQRVKIMERKGVYDGYIPLDACIPEGDYTLAAYTMFGESAGQDYFFKKRIGIRSPFSTRMRIDYKFEQDGDKLNVTLDYIDRTTGGKKEYAEMACSTPDGKEYNGGRGKKTRHLKLDAENCEGGCMLVRFNNYEKYVTLPRADSLFDVTFHPEGGYAVPGTSCCVAFKAINGVGRGVAVSGRVMDSHGEEVARFADLHRGMGVFAFVPQPGETYRAVVRYGDVEREFPLPEVNDRAAVLHVDNSRESTMAVEAVGAVPVGAYVAVLQRGSVLAAMPVDSGMFEMDKSQFPAGVVQVLLLDSSGMPLSERLVFMRGQGRSSARLASHLSAYLPRTKVRMTLNLEGYHAKNGNVAVAVTDNLMAEPDTLTSIESQLLLQSDLKGHIEDAGYYFRSQSRETNMALDALMMTQGWRRYDVPAAMSRDYSLPSTKLERGQEITGRVLSMWRKKPLTNASVQVLAPDRAFAMDARTDTAGRFTFKGFDFPEKTKFILQALNKKGKSEFNFIVDPDPFPAVNSIAMPYVGEGVAADSARTEQDSFSKWRMTHNNGVMEILLDEVSITYQKLSTKKPADIYEALATKSFGSDYFDENHISTYDEILRKIPGLWEFDGVITHRGRPVSYYVDGFAWSKPSGGALSYGGSPLSQAPKLWDFEQVYPLFTVKRIDFFRSGDAVIFGAENPGGVLMVTTKDGSEENGWNQPKNLQVVVPQGYQKRAEFYSPKYETDADADGTDMRPTVYWNPNIPVKKGKAVIEFFTSDNRKTDYTVRVEGVTSAGEIIHAKAAVRVE